MKKTIVLSFLFSALLTACNSSMSDNEIRDDVHRLISKTEQCFANVHNDLVDSAYLESFEKCNDELDLLIAEIDKKYENRDERHRFDSLFMEEIANSDLDNDLISTMQEIYGMNDEL